MALVASDPETPRCALAPQREEQTKCEIAASQEHKNKGEPSNLPPLAHHVTLSGWLSLRIKPHTTEDEGVAGHARREGAPDGSLERNPR